MAAVPNTEPNNALHAKYLSKVVRDFVSCFGHGPFVVFEGIEGAGKTSSLNRILELLDKDTFIPHKAVRYGSTALPDSITAPAIPRLWDRMKSSNGLAHEDFIGAMLYTASRVEENTRISNTLLSGKGAICDRYCGSTVVGQGYPEITVHKDSVIEPDCVIILDVENLEERKQRVMTRDAGNNGSPWHVDAGPTFYRKTIDTLLTVYSPMIGGLRGVNLIDTSGKSLEEVVAEIMLAITQRLTWQINKRSQG